MAIDIKLQEPIEAFPYKAPSQEIKEKYASLFSLVQPIPVATTKVVFDKVVAGLILFLCSPIVVLLYLLNLLEGLFVSENKGPLFFYYNGISQGKPFKKYKIRIIKMKFIDKELAIQGDWHAYKNEWNPATRTYLGHFVKKFYLDEIPQFFSVLSGKMSLVGPRPLAVHHYERDLAQGNITRKLLCGGLLGLGHIHKGTAEMGNPKYEYEYLDHCVNRSSWEILKLDISIIFKGVLLMSKGGGL